MIPISAATRVYLAVGATDLRKGFEGLSDLAGQVLEVDPLSGHLCIFCNRRRTRIKVLFFDRTGLWVCIKKLAKRTFSWPMDAAHGPRVSLSAEELSLLLGGIELERSRRKDWWRKEAA
jgi:transposase